jgi:hypothetical protein
MIVSIRQHRTKARPRFGRGALRRARASQPEADPASPGQPPTAAGEAGLSRERDAGGPDDRALYHCHCGYVFKAAVSTTVGCPHCGTAQVW